MPAERVSMRQIREVLRLRFASELPQRAIAKSLGLSQGAVSGYLSRARAAGVSWPLPADLDDVQLEGHRQLVASGQLNLGDRQLIEIYCQHTLQISAQISNLWVLDALCSAAVI